MPTTLLERVTITGAARDKAEAEFRDALRLAKDQHSWSELADAARMSVTGVRYLAANLNERRPSKRRERT